MASLKNSPGEYCLEQKAFCNQQQYLHYKNSRVPQVNKLPGLGINAGNMSAGYYDNVLSNNTANIESNLFGIKQIDLTKKQALKQIGIIFFEGSMSIKLHTVLSLLVDLYK